MQRYKVSAKLPNVSRKKFGKMRLFSYFLTKYRFLGAKRGENGGFSALERVLGGLDGGAPYYITRARREIFGVAVLV